MCVYVCVCVPLHVCVRVRDNGKSASMSVNTHEGPALSIIKVGKIISNQRVYTSKIPIIPQLRGSRYKARGTII